MKLHLCSAALVMIAAAGIASAQTADIESGFYVGGLAGVARYPNHPNVIVGNFKLNATDTREEDGSWGFVGGYRLGRYFAVEAGYLDLGAGTAKLVDSAGSDLHADMRFAVSGETLAFAGILPFGSRWEAFAKLAMLRQHVDFRLSGTQSATPFTLSSKTHGELRLYQEAGISYRFDPQWKATLGVSHFPNLGKKDVTGQASLLDTFVGVYYQF